MKQPNVYTIGEVVDLAIKAAAQAYNEVIDGGGGTSDAIEASHVAYRMQTPALTSVGAVQAYLALLVRGLEMGIYSPGEVRTLSRVASVWRELHQGKAADRAGKVVAL